MRFALQDVIRFEHLTKRYKAVVAVNNINFAISKGHIFGLLGPKGAGKTTAIKIMKDIINASKGQCFIMLSLLMSQYRKKLALNFSIQPYQTFLRLNKP